MGYLLYVETSIRESLRIVLAFTYCYGSRDLYLEEFILGRLNTQHETPLPLETEIRRYPTRGCVRYTTRSKTIQNGDT